MINKSIIVIVIILAIVMLGVGAVYLYDKQMPSQNTNTTQPSGTQGQIIFGIKDAAASMGNVSAVWIIMNNVQLHSQSQGWVTVSNDTKQYELLALKQSGNIAALATANVNADAYDQMRLTIIKVIAVENGAQKEVKLPSGDLKIMGQLNVSAQKQSTAVIDFMADESLHKTGAGKFIFTPVIKVETRSNATVQVDSNNNMNISGGEIDTSLNLGMDLNGQIKSNFMVDSDAKLDIVGNAIQIVSQIDNSVKITSSAAVNAAVGGGYLDTALSVQLTTQNDKKIWNVSGLKNLTLTNVSVDATTGAVVSY